MESFSTDIPDLVILQPDVFADDRGFFLETYNADRYGALGIPNVFLQDNVSRSKKGVFRGLHYQSPPFAQGKLVQVLCGSVLDVAIDIRKGSPTFGKYVVVELSEKNHRQFWIPEGFAHGFLSLEDDTLFQYKCTRQYSPEYDRGIRFDDPDIGLSFLHSDMIVSEKDRNLPFLKDADVRFQYLC